MEILNRNIVQGCSIAFDESVREHVLPIPDAGFYDQNIAIVGQIYCGIHPIDKELLFYRQHDSQDIGAPPTFYNFVEMLRIGLEKEPKKSKRDFDRSVQILKRVRQMNGKETYLPIKQVHKAVMKRCEYDSNRKEVNSASIYSNSIRALIDNATKGHYSRFGYGTKGTLSLGRDLLGVIGI
jgi:hypothetical protein